MVVDDRLGGLDTALLKDAVVEQPAISKEEQRTDGKHEFIPRGHQTSLRVRFH